MKIFYQSSLPRSGSTLLQNIIGQNPDFYVSPTSGLLELIFAARGNYTNSPEFKAQDQEKMKNAYISFCREGMNGYYTSLAPEKLYAVDKSRGWGIHYEFLSSIFPNPKIICIVRDLRDIITSMEKKFRQNEHLHDPIVEHNSMRGTSTYKRTEAWLNSPPIGLALERLSEIIRRGIDKNICFIKFEDLCKNPDTEMKKIYSYLDVPYYQHDFNNIEQITVEDDSIYGIYGDHNIKKKLEIIHSKHREILGKDISDWIWNGQKWFFDYFGYSY